ncbi:MAG: sodium-independent anion transporter [Clostridia bacterium]|nr:sodium-independent anion transporter [Clostridia bacterium]
MKIFEPKIISSLKGYTGKQLLSDVVAGIIVAIIALPLSIALAIASGAKPERGLYTAVVAGFVIALLGGSKVNISGPTAAFATIVAGIIGAEGKGFEGLVIATITAGLILILMGVFRVGTFIKYVPKSITVGFTAGIAVTILIGQLKDFTGADYSNPVETLEKVAVFFENIKTVNPLAILVGVISLAILIGWNYVTKKVPGSIIVVVLGILLVGITGVSVNTIGDLYTITPGFPKFSFPNITGELFIKMLPDAFTIAILAGIESLLSCVVSDGMIGDTHNPNTELIAQGVGNVCSGLFGGIPATGAIARTAANVKSGGRSPISGIVHALVLLLVLVVLMPYASFIPMPVIASILFIVAYNMSEWRSFVKIIKTKNVFDIIVLVLTFLLTVIFDLVVAIAVGLALHYAIVIIKKLASKKAE